HLHHGAGRMPSANSEEITGTGPEVSDTNGYASEPGDVERSPNANAVYDLVEMAPFGLYIVDSDLKIVQMNGPSKRNAFRNVRPVIGRDLLEALSTLWPPATAASIVARFR